jgi:hypothetical protein
LSHSLRLFGCFCGTFNPASRQILSNRLWLTLHPSKVSKLADSHTAHTDKPTQWFFPSMVVHPA